MMEPKFKLDLQGLIRTASVIATVIGVYYLDRSSIMQSVEVNAREISVLKTEVKKQKHLTLDELDDRYVSRREWDSNHRSLKEDVQYLRNKIDAIYDKVSGGFRK